MKFIILSILASSVFAYYQQQQQTQFRDPSVGNANMNQVYPQAYASNGNNGAYAYNNGYRNFHSNENSMEMDSREYYGQQRQMMNNGYQNGQRDAQYGQNGYQTNRAQAYSNGGWRRL